MTTTSLPVELDGRNRAPFVGRDTELDVLRGAWQAARSGTRRIALVAGEPGIGKTRLVAELAAAVHQQGGVVLHGRCDPDVVFPYQPFAEAYRQLARADDGTLTDVLTARQPALGLLVPELAASSSLDSGDAGSDRAAVFAACSAVLTSVAHSDPVLLAIDDVHWASGPSLMLLRHLVRTSYGARVLFAVTYRDTEVSRPGPLVDLLADLRNEPHVDRITLSGLDPQAVTELVTHMTDGALVPDAAGLATDLHRDTGGNPFFVSEVVRHLIESGRSVESALPESVRDVLATRIGRLPDETRAHLAHAAVIGPRFHLAVLNELDAPGDALDAIEPAIEARLVVELGEPVGEFAFAHALVRQALLDGLGPTRAARAHEQVAHVLERMGGEPAAVAMHYLAAARPEAVIRGARSALETAESITWRSAPEAAVELTGMAIRALSELSHVDAELEVELLCENAMGLLVLQRNAEFLAVTERAVQRAREAESDRLFALAVATRACYTPSGNADESFITDIDAALVTVAEDELALRSRLHNGLAIALVLMMRDRRLAIEHAREGARLADQSGVLLDRWMSRFAGTLAAVCEPDNSILRQFASELLEIGAEMADENATCHGLRAVATAELIDGDLDRAMALASECYERWDAINNVWGRGAGIMARYLESAARGRWDDAETALNDLLQIGILDPNFTTVYAGSFIMLRELQGRRAEIEPFMGASAASFPEVLSLRIAHGICLGEMGQIAEARAICDEVLSLPDMDKPDFAQLSRLAWATELAAMVHDEQHLRRLLDELLPWAGQVLVVNIGVGILGKVDAYLGAAAGVLGRHDDADRWFESALDWEDSSGCRPLAARTRLWWAQSLAPRDPQRAVDLLERCIATCDELEIVSIGAQARELLRTLTTSGL